MIKDLERDEPGGSPQADICIVGAGAAGIVLAVELARQGQRVLLLEAGGPSVEAASQDCYRSEVVGLPHRGVNTGRFRAHGGTTNRWGGQILELDACDFEKREWVEGSGWPFAKIELTRHYERALCLEGLGKVIRTDSQVWTKLGLEPPPLENLEPYFSRWCPQPNLAILHRDALEGGRIAVWLHANVTGLKMEGDVVRSVHCSSLGRKKAIFSARRFVFCMGSIESSRFFLQPREGGQPWNDSGLLGRHFQDHIDCNAAAVIPLRRRKFHEIFDNVFLDGFKYHSKVKITTSAMSQRRILNAGATMYFTSELDAELESLKTFAKKVLSGNLRQTHIRDLTRLAKNLPLISRQILRYKIQHRAYNPEMAKIQLRVHCEQEPLSRSSISLSNERDSLGMLRTKLDWRISDLERRTILEIAKLAKQEFASIAELVIDKDLEQGSDNFLHKCDDSNHHMGGMRMALKQSDGVVDVNLRLFGTRNCYICSAAVFPSSGFSNPTHTLLALAVRLAEHLNAN